MVGHPYFWSHSKSRPFANQPLFDHSQSRQVWISDPHFTLKSLKNKDIFISVPSGQPTEKLFEPGRFFTKYVSEIESDPVGNFDRCREALVSQNFGKWHLVKIFLNYYGKPILIILPRWIYRQSLIFSSITKNLLLANFYAFIDIYIIHRQSVTIPVTVFSIMTKSD